MNIYFKMKKKLSRNYMKNMKDKRSTQPESSGKQIFPLRNKVKEGTFIFPARL